MPNLRPTLLFWVIATTTLTKSIADESTSQPRVHIFFPNYKNEEDLYHSIHSHLLRQVGPVKYTVLNMGTADHNMMSRVKALESGGHPIEVVDFQLPSSIVGGEAVPHVLQRVDELTSADITVISDSDAFMLHPGWDEYLVTLFSTGYSLASINPRGRATQGKSTPFLDVPEWNWMAYKTELFHGDIRADVILKEFRDLHLHDWGHWLKYHNQKHELGSIFLWPGMHEAFKGKSAIVSGLSSPFVVHCFFGSRLRKESMTAQQAQWILTEDERQLLFRAAEEVNFNITAMR
jgi:hypothetical protein